MTETKPRQAKFWLRNPVGFKFEGTFLGLDANGFYRLLDSRTNREMIFNPAEVRNIEYLEGEGQ